MFKQAYFLMLRLWLFVVILLLPITGFAKGVVSDIRVWHSPERVRVVLDLSDTPKYKSFALQKPDRFVVDFYNLDIKANAPGPEVGGELIRTFRLGRPKKGVSRLVVDLRSKTRIKTTYIPAVPGFKPRLAIDFYPLKLGTGKITTNGKGPSSKQPSTVASKPAATQTSKIPKQALKKKDFVVVIDAGHGGEDPGASGRRAKEKKVVLAIARRLKKKIDATPGMRAVLTRNADYFIPLRKRTRLARKAKADLFVSIHADAFRKKSARGSSVFVLSLKGASSEEAKWLAQKENAADLVGGVELSSYDKDVRELLLDLSMETTIHESILFAKEVLQELKKIGKVHNRKVGRAGFVVLKSPDIPSILIETAFITNPKEERLLRSAKHQEKLANAILSGIKRYAKKSTQGLAIR